MAVNAQPSEQMELAIPVVSFRGDSDTLLIDNVELRLDTQLGDEELGVSLLIESLEQQYQDMLHDGESGEAILSLQSAKEWLNEQPGKVAGLFSYLKNLSTESTTETGK